MKKNNYIAPATEICLPDMTMTVMETLNFTSPNTVTGGFINTNVNDLWEEEEEDEDESSLSSDLLWDRF